MQNGWIKLHRKIQENGIYSDSNMLKLWIHCLLKASHKERSQLVGNQMVELLPGEFITGREVLSDEFNKGVKKADRVSAITLFRWLNNFEKWQMLNIKKTTKYSVVTVLGWSEYQHDEQQLNNKRTTDDQQLNTNKNVKNEKNEKKIDMGGSEDETEISKPKRKTEKKLEYAELVKMTETEYSKLVESHGEPATKSMIEILDNYKGSKGKNYASDYRAILSWVVKRFQQENNIFVPTQSVAIKTSNPFIDMNAGE